MMVSVGFAVQVVEHHGPGSSVALVERAMKVLVKFAAPISIPLAVLSAYPGVLNDFAVVAILLYLIVIGGWIVVLMNARAPEREIKPELRTDDEIGGGKSPVPNRRWFKVAIATLILSVVLMMNGIPRRVAFALSRPAFQQHAAKAPVSEYNGEGLGRRLGVYYVDRYAADPRGGVYFRTHSGADGIGPDTMSYGFACRPNREGTPFGNAAYRYAHVVGDWYEFSASNDF
jgi:hypothetical protein